MAEHADLSVYRPLVSIRWYKRSDLDRIVAIERRCFDHPWGHREFLDFASDGRCYMLLAEVPSLSKPGEYVTAGFALVEKRPLSLRLEGLAVDPDWQRKGVGAALVSKLKRKVAGDGRRLRLRADVPEECLPMQCLLRSCGVRCVGVNPAFDEDDEASYRFKWDVREGW